MKLCSACLLGVKCGYDGKDRADPRVIELAKNETLIPICPEQLGGLPTPREESEIRGESVFTKSGEDVTANLERGAREVLNIAKLFDAKGVIFKQRSPSCGCGKIYDGSFSGKVVEGDGIVTALMKKNGFTVISEEDL